MKYNYTPVGVCSRNISFEIDEKGVISNLKFEGGCHGNTQGVCALAEGRSARQVSECLKGIDCKGRGTSCPDQLAVAIEQALKKTAGA